MPIPGVALIDKPEGVTSFGALSEIKRRVGHGKVGHAGTLDKFATGLLIVLIGAYTKLTPYLSGLDKSYEGVMRFGSTTETLDPEGDEIGEYPIPARETIENGIAAFTGSFAQVPPKFSAVHVDGKRAYRRALSGEDIEIPARSVTVGDFRLLAWEPPELRFSVSCSKGTYIRSLARDLGKYCDSAAYLTELRRTSVGELSIEDAVAPDAFDPEHHMLSDWKIVENVPNCRPLVIRDEARERIANGAPIDRRALIDESAEELEGYQGEVGLLDSDRQLLAFVTYERERFSYRFVLPTERPTEKPTGRERNAGRRPHP